MNYLITYDVENNKNRKKLSDLLEGYGVRVNYSVFECEFNKTKLNKLLKQIKEQKLYDKSIDSIRFYHICQNCISKSFELTDRGDIFEDIEFFI